MPLTLTRRQPDEGRWGAIWWQEQRFPRESYPEATPPRRSAEARSPQLSKPSRWMKTVSVSPSL
ncbi:hypothetical protein ACQY74_002864 [Rhizobium leguminosarum bv. trifolii]